MLLVEVNHRAKNSLAIAACLLGIQGRRQPDPAVRALFEEARDVSTRWRGFTTCSASRKGLSASMSATYVADLCGALAAHH